MGVGAGSLKAGEPVTGSVGRADIRAGLAAKRVIDVVVSLILLVLLAPALLIVALAILVLDGRPIFFRQQRVGRYGELFTIFKFRTMVPDAHQRLDEVAHANERHGPLFKATDDPRVTAVGGALRRTSLDELPQLFNVLLGTMSLVGPRPALPEERSQFPAELLEREQLPQGLSGLWQLEGRNNSDFSVYRQLDLDYVRSWSLSRDVSILVRTPFVVFLHALRRQPPAMNLDQRLVDITVPTSTGPARGSVEHLALDGSTPARASGPVAALVPVDALAASAVSLED